MCLFQDVLIRLRTMAKTEPELKAKISALEAQRKRLIIQVTTLRDQFHHMKFTGESKLSA